MLNHHHHLSTVSPEDTSQTSILLRQGAFSWQGPDVNEAGDTENEVGRGSLLLHSLDLHVIKVESLSSCIPHFLQNCAELQLKLLLNSWFKMYPSHRKQRNGFGC